MDYILLDDKISLLNEVRLYDRDFKKHKNGHLCRRVYSPENAIEDYNNRYIEKIVVCTLTHANSIVDYFIRSGVDVMDIWTVDKIVFGM